MVVFKFQLLLCFKFFKLVNSAFGPWERALHRCKGLIIITNIIIIIIIIIISKQNDERCLFTFEKNNLSNQKPEWCTSFAPSFPVFYIIGVCSAFASRVA